MGPEDAAPATVAPSTRTYDYEIILVTYQSRDLVADLLPTLPRDVPIAIVDNAQGADGIDELVRDRAATRYLHGPDEGFATAANLGARTSTYPTLVFLDPDGAPTVEQLDALVGALRRDSRLALVSATTVLPDGRVELGVGGWEPTVGRAVVHALGAHRLFPTKGLFARPRPGRPITLDWLGGACMAAPREVFLGLGGFDESYYVYNEDVEFGRRIREAGLRQRILTDVLVPHGSSESGDDRSLMLQMRGAMTMKYVARHNSRATARAIRVALTVGYAGRYVLRRLRGPHARARAHAAFVRGMWAGAPDMG